MVNSVTPVSLILLTIPGMSFSQIVPLEGEVSGEETVEELEREILKGMRMLARKFNRLEKLLAQDKRRV